MKRLYLSSYPNDELLPKTTNNNPKDAKDDSPCTELPDPSFFIPSLPPSLFHDMRSEKRSSTVVCAVGDGADDKRDGAAVCKTTIDKGASEKNGQGRKDG